MWRQLARRRLPSSRLLIPTPPYRIQNTQKRWTSRVAAPSKSEGYTQDKRLVTISIAFLAGFSIYFFLDDPVPPTSQGQLSPKQFTPSLVLSSEDSGPNSKLIKLAIPKHLIPSKNFNPIWSVYIKDDDIQVERAYTPLSGVDENGHMTFWIKRYPRGEVGRWLHTKQPGDKIEFRGPLTTWPWREDTWDEIVMISGGTGITPFVQLFNNVIRSEETVDTRFTLLHSSRTPEELPPPALLDPLIQYADQHPDKFRLHIFVDDETGSKRVESLPRLNTGRITENELRQYLGLKSKQTSWWSRFWHRKPPQDEAKRKILFLVCGPEPMTAAIAGPYGRNFSQGPVGGALGRIGYTSNQVYKL